jgi:hypothetical protein
LFCTDGGDPIGVIRDAAGRYLAALVFVPAETEAFLRFLEPRLLDPPHPLSLCRMNRALARARVGGNLRVAGAPGWPATASNATSTRRRFSFMPIPKFPKRC